ncbi:hypothetical protein B0H19DRAFT_1065468 [Mycena capillaripes]|nr:hypothetical protein B0H19DRAFT_1065468 [Mycena capillaripes]
MATLDQSNSSSQAIQNARRNLAVHVPTHLTMVNITRAALAAFSSCLFVDFQGNRLTNWANLPPPPVANIPVVALQPGGPITAGQVWNITVTGDPLGPYAIQNFTTGMWFGYSQTFLQAFTQAVLQGTQSHFNIVPALGIPGTFTVTSEFGDVALTSWPQAAPLGHSAVTWELFTPGFAQQVWVLKAEFLVLILRASANGTEGTCVLPV